MMPVPSHLKGVVVPLNKDIGEDNLSANFRCQCGESRFELLYPGKTHKFGGKLIPCTIEIDGHFFFVLKSRCTSCGHEHLLLDTDFHGWDGFICHDPDQASLKRPQLVPWQCQKCGETKHNGIIHIESQGEEDFVLEVGEDFDVDRWPDAFSWFSMDLTCCKCGLESQNIISVETM